LEEERGQLENPIEGNLRPTWKPKKKLKRPEPARHRSRQRQAAIAGKSSRELARLTPGTWMRQLPASRRKKKKALAAETLLQQLQAET